MCQDLLDNHRVFNTGNDLDGTFALLSFGDVDIEHPFQAPGPGHRGTAFHGRAVVSFGGVLLPCPVWPG